MIPPAGPATIPTPAPHAAASSKPITPIASETSGDSVSLLVLSESSDDSEDPPDPEDCFDFEIPYEMPSQTFPSFTFNWVLDTQANPAQTTQSANTIFIFFMFFKLF